ncbi:MAG: methyltransferase, TIGR04325 family [Schwartzia succinivorans]|nr:methyltransferase, TIGR04325 family [Schwartzia succinivorans]
MTVKNVLKKVLPPILLDAFHFMHPGEFYGLSGSFSSWEEAEQHLQKEFGAGYAEGNILQQVLAAVQEVRAGRAVFERDGVLFYEQEYNYPFLAALFYALNGCLSSGSKHPCVLDFGGSLGSTFFQNRGILAPFSCRWHIVEQPHFVEVGRLHVPEITFHESVESYIEHGDPPDVLLLCSVLQYFDRPYEYMDRILGGHFKYILVDRSFFNDKEPDNDRLVIQTVSPSIYSAAYPAWLLSMERVRGRIEREGYEKVMQWEAFDRMPVKEEDGERWILPSRGFLVEWKA